MRRALDDLKEVHKRYLEGCESNKNVNAFGQTPKFFHQATGSPNALQVSVKEF